MTEQIGQLYVASVLVSIIISSILTHVEYISINKYIEKEDLQYVNIKYKNVILSYIFSQLMIINLIPVYNIINAGLDWYYHKDVISKIQEMFSEYDEHYQDLNSKVSKNEKIL